MFVLLDRPGKGNGSLSVVPIPGTIGSGLAGTSWNFEPQPFEPVSHDRLPAFWSSRPWDLIIQNRELRDLFLGLDF